MGPLVSTTINARLNSPVRYAAEGLAIGSLPAIDRILLSRAQRIGEVRVAQRQYRPRLQFPDEERQPHAAKPDDRDRIEPVDRQSLGAELRRDQPEEVYHSHHDHQPRERSQPSGAPLQIAREQQRERQREMQDDQ